MPTSGPVYQPTTVSYEQQSEWSQPSNGLINRTLNHIRNPRWFHWSFILISWILIAIGVFLFLSITTNFVSSNDIKDNYTEDIAFLVIGSFCFVFGVVLLIGYFRYIKDKESCPCFNSKARQMESQSSNGQVLTLNPSTDLLMASAQYGPTSEAPPTIIEEDETRKLMGNDNKDCNDERDHMLVTSNPPVAALRTHVPGGVSPLSGEDA
ncbi:uncharacterized protein LOC112592485 [Melanaphis sacchari]|uniref:uncharacterized protein LOC112592485 n=1 Tax=Melanaphis sacchari TaxID=742174 RepID=UPI000DC15053|nr:uncharacterized protein LOC112592485 [Melanaphis sacchari]XP_025192342.1 uncharacterized protein LOC112592485 [Melanaphis sacchari]